MRNPKAAKDWWSGEGSFDQMVCDCFPENTKVAWAEFDTVTFLKYQGPVSWRCALSEYESEEESEGHIISLDGGSTYFNSYDVEKLLEEERVASATSRAHLIAQKYFRFDYLQSN